LLERHQKRIYNTVLGMVGNADDAAELTQEVFLKAFKGLGSFRGESRFTTWLFRITFNCVTSYRRKPKMVSESLLSGGEDCDEPVSVPSDDPGPSEQAEAREIQRRVREAIGRLDEDARALVVLRDMQGMDYEEISVTLELPLGTVKSRLHRARMQLKTMLEPYLQAGLGTDQR